MRTTLTIDDRLARELKEIAHRSGKPFKAVVNEALRAGLSAKTSRRARRRHRIATASLGRVLANVDLHVDLDRALASADRLEDLEIVRKLEERK